MKGSLTIFALSLLFSVSAHAQMRVIYPEGVKTIIAPLPTFPAEAKDLIYGEKVTGAIAYWPLVPCSNLTDPTVEAIRKAALAAASSTIFEPIQKDGKATEERVNIGYRLRSLQSPLPAEQRKIVSIGVANSRATLLPKPEYPEGSKALNLKGSITVQVLIDESGNVISAGPISGQPQFGDAGVVAACGAKFRPMTIQNQPAKMLGAIAYNFAP
jgi:TonB family protein